jgi:YVTN family beta-propeller protein
MALTRNNSVAIYDLAQKVFFKQIPVGMVPYALALSKDGSELYVSDWGGREAKEGDTTANSSGSRLVVDQETGIVNTGVVSVIDFKEQKVTETLEVGLHPCGMCLGRDGTRLFVANANSDTVSVIDTLKREVVEEIPVKADPSLPLGSSPNALALSPDGKKLYVALGGNNAVAVLALGSASAKSLKSVATKLEGLIPTGWYPGALLLDAEGKRLVVANTKGIGSLDSATPTDGHLAEQFLGTVSIIDLPSTKQLAQWTDQVKLSNKTPQALNSLKQENRKVSSQPVPARIGDLSVFKVSR